MPKVTITYIIKVQPGMRITRIVVNNAELKMGQIPPPVGDIVKGDIEFFLGMEDYFSFTLNGVGISNTAGTFNFEYEGDKVMKKDKDFTVKSGLINVFLSKIMLP